MERRTPEFADKAARRGEEPSHAPPPAARSPGSPAPPRARHRELSAPRAGRAVRATGLRAPMGVILTWRERPGRGASRAGLQQPPALAGLAPPVPAAAPGRSSARPVAAGKPSATGFGLSLGQGRRLSRVPVASPASYGVCFRHRAQPHAQAAQPASPGGGALRPASRPSTRPARGAPSSSSSARGGAGPMRGRLGAAGGGACRCCKWHAPDGTPCSRRSISDGIPGAGAPDEPVIPRPRRATCKRYRWRG